MTLATAHPHAGTREPATLTRVAHDAPIDPLRLFGRRLYRAEMREMQRKYGPGRPGNVIRFARVGRGDKV